MPEFLNEVFFCHPNVDVFYDTRDHDAGTKIAAFVRIIAEEDNYCKREQLIKNSTFQIYPHGYPSGRSHLWEDILAKIGGDLDSTHIMQFKDIIWVVKDGDSNNPQIHEDAGARYINSFHSFYKTGNNKMGNNKIGYRVTGHHIPVCTDDEWVKHGTDTVNLQNNHILHNLLSKYKTDYPNLPIIVTSKVLTTTRGDILIHHLFKDAEAHVLNPKLNMKDYLYIQHTKLGAAFKRGADVVLMDCIIHELAIIASQRVDILAPAKATNVVFYPLSQEALQEMVESSVRDGGELCPARSAQLS
ncbi:hypothetical protein J3R82DRAFT_10576 [Butyriboletus roseoflavus]|nr:hypothetical protein J3R82DRAFT_10576 [Butyriboletus roseoflavus]